MHKRHIIIIGFMGTGKSTLGAEIARISHLPFVDLDEDIEKKVGICIANIFEKYGETYFRDLESERLEQLVVKQDKPIILSTGGGAVLREENQRVMMNHGFVVNTKATREEIVRRLQNDPHSRPLLAGDLEERVDRLLQERNKAYDFADFTIQTDQLELGDAAKLVWTVWKDVILKGDFL